MFARILVAIDDFDQSPAVLGLVKEVATEGVTEVRALHLRVREVSGYQWYSRETRDRASFVAEAATFELRMAGLAAGGSVRYAAVDRVAQAILAEAKAFDAQLVVLGSPRRGELLARLRAGTFLLTGLGREDVADWVGRGNSAAIPGGQVHKLGRVAERAGRRE